MQDLSVFSIGHQRNRWLSARVAVLANNVANADTPGFKPSDVPPFAAALASGAIALGRTQPGHIDPGADHPSGYEPAPRSSSTPKHSGNGVSLELEMAQLGETRSEHSAVTGVLAAFHRMLMSASRG